MDASPIDRPQSARKPDWKSAWPPVNAVGALIVGALTGSTLLAGVTVIAGFATMPGDPVGAFSGGLVVALAVLVLSLPVWAGGLIMVGIPGWLVLHALRWRSRGAAVLFGGVATFVVAGGLGLWLDLRPASAPWAFPVALGVLALIGAVVGWTVATIGRGEKGSAR